MLLDIAGMTDMYHHIQLFSIEKGLANFFGWAGEDL
jgi:hypothetical protein